jgi:hypothetical protein
LTAIPRIRSKGLSTAGQRCEHMTCIDQSGITAVGLDALALAITSVFEREGVVAKSDR